MGDIADMVLDGTLCQVCGDLLNSPDSLKNSIGYPTTCIICKLELLEELRRDE